EIDVGLIYGPGSTFHMRVEELFGEELVAVGPPSGTLSCDKPITLATLARLPLILPSRPHGLRMVIESAAHVARIKLEVRCEADSFRVLVSLVEQGLGYTILPLSAITGELDEGRLTYAPLGEPKIVREVVLGTPDTITSHATRKVIELTRDEIAQLTRSGTWRAKLRFRSGARTR
ncbi:MAG TPA: LysR substrate-binding domain-containing protein, partial [Steroidobacteraceae bacterium]|nr:LysR substrate-binding domain-containing protein [Steroidobacteraceae bacterium]